MTTLRDRIQRALEQVPHNATCLSRTVWALADSSYASRLCQCDRAARQATIVERAIHAAATEANYWGRIKPEMRGQSRETALELLDAYQNAALRVLEGPDRAEGKEL